MTERKLIEVLSGKVYEKPPMWIMRQAGRYLPEYREIRSTADGFLDLCYSPKLASEITLQPLRRFDLDAAIIFSDILVVPHALGQDLWFEEGRGPRLNALKTVEDVHSLDVGRVLDFLQPVFESLNLVRSSLDEKVALLGFCGGPWTVATYMIEGGSSNDHGMARRWAYGNNDLMNELIDKLVEASILYLIQQLRSGADAVQIFDSWAGILDMQGFRDFCINPIKRIVEGVRGEIPDAKIIGFPRGAGERYKAFTELTGVNCVGVDYSQSLSFVRSQVGGIALQGNLDPLRVVAGGRELESSVETILEEVKGYPYVFNLGHGIVPDTPIDHVERLVQLVKG